MLASRDMIGIVLGSYEAIILQQNSSISIHQLLSDDEEEDIFISIKNNVECKPTTELLCQICTVGQDNTRQLSAFAEKRDITPDTQIRKNQTKIVSLIVCSRQPLCKSSFKQIEDELRQNS